MKMWPVTYQKHSERLLKGTDTLLPRQTVLSERGRCGADQHHILHLSTENRKRTQPTGPTGESRFRVLLQVILGVSDTKVIQETQIFKSPQEGETIVSWPSWKLRAEKLFSESPGSENLRIKSLWFLQTSMRAIKIVKIMDLCAKHWLLTFFSISISSGYITWGYLFICYHFRQAPRVVS